ncbi:transcriptional regulator domain-containing protein [Novosphingobium sp. P6W]|uniref:transcriptional regulator domain-containing protein n=1 Tax=Novosphingobium sp. P6W TaxID=1609758 RepID=UPI003518C6BE
MVGSLAHRLVALSRRGRGGLAWEVLRRDPAYRAAWKASDAGRTSGDDRQVGSGTVFTAREWGLHFRRESRGGLYAGGAGMVRRPGPVRPARPHRTRTIG